MGYAFTFNLQPFPFCLFSSKDTMSLALKSDPGRGQAPTQAPTAATQESLGTQSLPWRAAAAAPSPSASGDFHWPNPFGSQRHKITGNTVHDGQPPRHTAWQRTERKDNGDVVLVASGN